MSYSTSPLSSDTAILNPHPVAPVLRVIKRDGSAAAFTVDKIILAITKAIIAVEGEQSSESARVRKVSHEIANHIKQRLAKNGAAQSSVHIEDIQDQVELGLMRHGMQKVARAYVLYREEQATKRLDTKPVEDVPYYEVLASDGQRYQLAESDIKSFIAKACEGLGAIDVPTLTALCLRNLYQGIQQRDLATALIMAARAKIEHEPQYSDVCARLLNMQLSAEVFQALTGQRLEPLQVAELYKPHIFALYLETGISKGLLSEELRAFDIDTLAHKLQPERDLQFSYLGLQTLYDRYFVHSDGERLEAPQFFFMRVAMGLAIRENDPNARAIEFYDLLSSFDYMASTPTLFNAGTKRPQLSSCYLTTVPDDLSGIYDALKSNALLSKWAGGLGNDWTPVRALGAHIEGTNGQSQGVVPFLKVVNDTAVAVNQGGKRKGAVCAYLESWHLDIEDFLELRKNTGDERRRTHDMNSANWIPDLFMKRVFEEAEWTLFSPDDVEDLHDLYGKQFETRYQAYEAMADAGKIKLFKRIPAQELWRKMLSMLFETGHPWITFKDPCNLRSPQQHMGVVHSSNLCTEITLNTSQDEIAVCNLGSINLVQHVGPHGLDRMHLERTIKSAVRMLDNVVDINYYACEEAKRSNLRHRPVGLGVMGFQDALYKLGMAYASIDAVQFADESSELISYLALSASCELAQERGVYDSFEGSLWSQGKLPIDSLLMMEQERGKEYCVFDYSCSLDWRDLRTRIQKVGMRNSNVLAIAPTATISNIVGVSQSIEPTYQNLFVKSNLSGEFTMVNPWLVQRLKEHGLWDAAMVNDLKYYDGSVQSIERIPEPLKLLFRTAFELEPHWLIEAAARRQKWLDQAQSLNLYMSEPSGKKLDNLYKTAWSRGLKTTYYLRSLAATHMEKHSQAVVETLHENHEAKFNAEDGAFNLGEGKEAPKMCSILEPDCEACQ